MLSLLLKSLNPDIYQIEWDNELKGKIAKWIYKEIGYLPDDNLLTLEGREHNYLATVPFLRDL